MSNQAERSGREYPTAPIVGVAGVVIHANAVLLIRRGREPMLGKWSLPGGALELGETMAAGVAREVLEETCLRVTPLEIVATLDRIVRDEAGRVRFHHLLIDWVCVVADRGQTIPLAGDDAQEAVWVARGDLGLTPSGANSEPGRRSTVCALDAVTLRVIEDGFTRAEALGL